MKIFRDTFGRLPAVFHKIGMPCTPADRFDSDAAAAAAQIDKYAAGQIRLEHIKQSFLDPIRRRPRI